MWLMLMGVAGCLVGAPLLETAGWRWDATWALLAGFLATQTGNRAVVGAALAGLVLDVIAGGTLGPRLFGLTLALTLWSTLSPRAEAVSSTGGLRRRNRWNDGWRGAAVLALVAGGTWWGTQFTAYGLERGWGRDWAWKGSGVVTEITTAWERHGREGVLIAVATGLLAGVTALACSRAAGEAGRGWA